MHTLLRTVRFRCSRRSWPRRSLLVAFFQFFNRLLFFMKSEQATRILQKKLIKLYTFRKISLRGRRHYGMCAICSVSSASYFLSWCRYFLRILFNQFKMNHYIFLCKPIFLMKTKIFTGKLCVFLPNFRYHHFKYIQQKKKIIRKNVLP